MNQSDRFRNLIEQLARQEIDKIASETENKVKEIVRANLLPQLRMAIRDSISEAMEEVLSEAKNLPPAQETGISEEISEITPSERSVPHLTSPLKGEKGEGEAEIGFGDGDGRYVYGVADSGVAVNMGKIGIENTEVYTIPYKDVCAIVHNCRAEPYQSQDNEVVKKWLQVHEHVLDEATQKLGTVIPAGFDIIIKSENGIDSKQTVKNWLKDNFENFREKINKIRGKQEYGIQIFYNPKAMGEVIARDSVEVQKLREEMSSQKPGMAYMHKQKIEKAVKEEMEKKGEKYFDNFYKAIKSHVDDIKVEKTKKTDNKVMFMNLSCLVLKEKVKDLGDELEKIDNMDGLSVRFTGPWPPYSFI